MAPEPDPEKAAKMIDCEIGLNALVYVCEVADPRLTMTRSEVPLCAGIEPFEVLVYAIVDAVTEQRPLPVSIKTSPLRAVEHDAPEALKVTVGATGGKFP